MSPRGGKPVGCPLKSASSRNPAPTIKDQVAWSVLCSPPAATTQHACIPTPASEAPQPAEGSAAPADARRSCHQLSERHPWFPFEAPSDVRHVVWSRPGAAGLYGRRDLHAICLPDRARASDAGTSIVHCLCQDDEGLEMAHIVAMVSKVLEPIHTFGTLELNCRTLWLRRVLSAWQFARGSGRARLRSNPLV